eukprot:SM000132S26881  [mRNA]  locus=s132:198210:200980:+ [translate_table: standard]
MAGGAAAAARPPGAAPPLLVKPGASEKLAAATRSGAFLLHGGERRIARPGRSWLSCRARSGQFGIVRTADGGRVDGAELAQPLRLPDHGHTGVGERDAKQRRPDHGLEAADGAATRLGRGSADAAKQRLGLDLRERPRHAGAAAGGSPDQLPFERRGSEDTVIVSFPYRVARTSSRDEHWRQQLDLARRLRRAAALLLAAALVGSAAFTLSRSSRNPKPAGVSLFSTATTSAAALEKAGRPSLWGHFKYAEAPYTELVPVLADGSVKLRRAAARSFERMQADARRQGVLLVPLSGFRSISAQEGIFYDVKAFRNQKPAERAKVSAPPGHSEHHTGFVIDIGDGRDQKTDVCFEFEQTRAFDWLQHNANRQALTFISPPVCLMRMFNFEMSFPPGNSQGISYEPWHWRFVGDRQSQEIFYPI